MNTTLLESVPKARVPSLISVPCVEPNIPYALAPELVGSRVDRAPSPGGMVETNSPHTARKGSISN